MSGFGVWNLVDRFDAVSNAVSVVQGMTDEPGQSHSHK